MRSGTREGDSQPLPKRCKHEFSLPKGLRLPQANPAWWATTAARSAGGEPAPPCRSSAPRATSAVSDHRFPGHRGKPPSLPDPYPLSSGFSARLTEPRTEECNRRADLVPSGQSVAARLEAAGGREARSSTGCRQERGRPGGERSDQTRRGQKA